MKKSFLTISMGLLMTGAALADDSYSCLSLSATETGPGVSVISIQNACTDTVTLDNTQVYFNAGATNVGPNQTWGFSDWRVSPAPINKVSDNSYAVPLIPSPGNSIGLAVSSSLSFTAATTEPTNLKVMPAPALQNVNIVMPANPGDNVPQTVTISGLDHSVSAAWGTTTSVMVNPGSYTPSIGDVMGDTNMYHFNLDPASLNLPDAKPATTSTENVSFSSTAMPMGTVSLNLSQVPAGSTANISLQTTTNQGTKTYALDPSNPTSVPALPGTTYTVKAAPIIITNDSTKLRYVPTVTPTSFSVTQGNTQNLSVTYPATGSIMVPFAPYADMSQPGILDYLETYQVPAVRLAFVNDNADGSKKCQAFAGNPSAPLSNYQSLFDSLQTAQKIPFVVSFGGYISGSKGYDLSETCSNGTELAKTYQSVIDAAKKSATDGKLGYLTGLDFDIESDLAGNTDAQQKIATALQIIQTNNPDLTLSLTLPVFPTGLSKNGMDLVTAVNAGGIKFQVNLMTMDYGDACPAGCMSQRAEQAVDNTAAQLSSLRISNPYQKIAITPMIGQNDTAGEVFDFNDAANVLAYASSKNLAFISFWAINRDQNCGPGGALYQCSLIPQNNGDFAKAFMGLPI